MSAERHFTCSVCGKRRTHPHAIIKLRLDTFCLVTSGITKLIERAIVGGHVGHIAVSATAKFRVPITERAKRTPRSSVIISWRSEAETQRKPTEHDPELEERENRLHHRVGAHLQDLISKDECSSCTVRDADRSECSLETVLDTVLYLR